MGFFAFPYTSVLDVSANSLLGNNTGSNASAIALTDSQVRSLISVYSTTEVDTLLSGKANTSHTHAASDITSGTIATSLLGSGTADNTTYLRGDQTWATVTAGIGGSSGSTDNAVLRADGTGGATVQASSFVIPDNYTASPNATVNHASIQATGATTNVSVSIVPKGTGSLSLHVPDGTITGGNERGVNAVDLQTVRTNANQVASGPQSALLWGAQNRVTNSYSAAGGQNSLATGAWAVAFGRNAQATGHHSAAFGYNNICSGDSTLSQGRGNTASGASAVVLGRYSLASEEVSLATGIYSSANKYAQRAIAAGRFSATGDAQSSELVVRNSTTDAAQKELFLNGSSLRITIANDTTWAFDCLIVARRTDANDESAAYRITGCIDRNANAASTALVNSSVTVIAEDTAAWDVDVIADTTNGSLNFRVTGEAGKTIRWVGWVRLVEVTG